MSTSLLLFTSGLVTQKYLWLFLASCLEGPIITTLSGVLIKQGTMSFWPVYGIVMAGDLIRDLIWYGIGYYYALPFVRKYGRFFSLNEEMLLKAKTLFDKHQNNILFLSKVTMGFGFALLTLITAGMMHVPLRRYLVINALGQLIWTLFLLALGYFFGGFFLTIDKGLKVISLIAFVLVLLVILHGVQRYLRKKNLSPLA